MPEASGGPLAFPREAGVLSLTLEAGKEIISLAAKLLTCPLAQFSGFSALEVQRELLW